MAKLNIKFIGLLILLSAFGCGSNESALIEKAVGEPMVSPTNQQKAIDVERKLIKKGSVTFETEDISSTRKLIFDSIKKYGAYTSSDQANNLLGRISNTIIIRVPAEKFDLLLNEATKDVTKFDNKKIEVKDVTEEFLDIEARVKTKKELENRYLELLEKANSVTEILEVEKQAGQLRAEIESIEGRLKYLESQVSLSTLSISFYKNVRNKTEFRKKFKDGFKNGWENLILFFVFLTNIWPFILIGIGLIFGFKMWRKKNKGA